MKTHLNRPKVLWSQKAHVPCVEKYFNSYSGEFDTDYIESNYPYSGPASGSFRRLTSIPDYEEETRFEGKGAGCWVPRRDHILNDLTADLFAAADLLAGSENEEAYSSAMPGGIGADMNRFWLPFLDGGLGVEVTEWEHQYTNRVHARQWTTIRGAHTYRALLLILGFNWPKRKLHGEESAPDLAEFIDHLNELIGRKTA